MTEGPTIEEAIEKNLTISFVEPDTDGVTPVQVTRTCAEVIKQGKAYLAYMAKERPGVAEKIAKQFPNGYPDREHVLDYIAVHWATINPSDNEHQKETDHTETTGDP